MSFGFSVSDIVGCAHLAYILYDEFKEAQGACQKFLRELLLFHQVLVKMYSTASQLELLDSSDQAALNSCLDSCKELLYVQIMGTPTLPDDTSTVPEEYWDLKIYGCRDKTDLLVLSPFEKPSVWNNLRRRLGARQFALRIPKLQNAISSHIEKLNILLALCVIMLSWFSVCGS